MSNTLKPEAVNAMFTGAADNLEGQMSRLLQDYEQTTGIPKDKLIGALNDHAEAVPHKIDLKGMSDQQVYDAAHHQLGHVMGAPMKQSALQVEKPEAKQQTTQPSLGKFTERYNREKAQGPSTERGV